MEENKNEFKYNVRLHNQIKNDLIKQIGNVQKHYQNLIDDYMKLWIIKEQLNADISDRGIQVSYTNSRGYIDTKKNESITEIVKVNAQMIKILDVFGIKPSVVKAGDKNEDYI